MAGHEGAVPTREMVLAKVAEGDHKANEAMRMARSRDDDMRGILDDIHRKMDHH